MAGALVVAVAGRETVCVLRPGARSQERLRRLRLKMRNLRLCQKSIAVKFVNHNINYVHVGFIFDRFASVMARSSGKRAFKSQHSGTQSRTGGTPSDIPTPFKPLPTHLQPFASTLPTDHFYITHLDQNDVSVKKQAFLVPLVLNLLIICILCGRAYYAAPVYLSLILTVFGHETPHHVSPSQSSSGDILSMIFSRTLLMMTDYALFWVLGSWPREFLLGSVHSRYVGPVGWKLNVGFKEQEIVVRKGRRWDTGILEDDQRSWNLDNELTIKFKVEAAMRKSYSSKTALSLLDRDWELDYHAMSDAHQLVEEGTLKPNDLQELGLVYYHKQWLVWNIHEAHEVSLSDLEADEKVRDFREKLTSRGLEDVFFRWIEMVQYETNQPGGFSDRRKSEALRQMQRMVSDKNVDYQQFVMEVGGQDKFPGMD